MWELTLLDILRWDLSAAIAPDYLDYILPKIRLDGLGSTFVRKDEVKRRAETALVLAALDYRFARLVPSLLVSAALKAVISAASRAEYRLGSPGHDHLKRRQQVLEEVLSSVRALTKTEKVRNPKFQAKRL